MSKLDIRSISLLESTDEQDSKNSRTSMKIIRVDLHHTKSVSSRAAMLILRLNQRRFSCLREHRFNFQLQEDSNFWAREEIFFLKISRRANFSVDKASGRSFSRFFSISDWRRVLLTWFVKSSSDKSIEIEVCSSIREENVQVSRISWKSFS